MGIVEQYGPWNDPRGHGGAKQHLHLGWSSRAEAKAAGFAVLARWPNRGVRISQHPDFGRVDRIHSAGSLHYAEQGYRAWDLNQGYGSPPSERSLLWEIYVWLRDHWRYQPGLERPVEEEEEVDQAQEDRIVQRVYNALGQHNDGQTRAIVDRLIAHIDIRVQEADGKEYRRKNEVLEEIRKALWHFGLNKSADGKEVALALRVDRIDRMVRPYAAMREFVRKIVGAPEPDA